jgi:hypothetical protein
MHKTGIKIVFILMVFALACNSDSKPSIDKKTMASILAELQLSEAKVSRMNLSSLDSSKAVFSFLEKKAYKKFKTDSLTFSSNYKIYSKDKEQLLEIYTKALEILEKSKKQNTEQKQKI